MAVFSVFILGKNLLYAQQGYVFRHVSSNEGLPNNNVKWITTDEFGLIWIATENGIARFDGSFVDVFKAGSNSYGPVGGSVHFMGVLPRSHLMWVGSTTGLSCYNQKNKRWYRVPLLYNSDTQTLLPTYVYPFHVDNRQQIWLYIGYYGSICTYRPTTGEIKPITKKSNGRIYTCDSLFAPLEHAVSLLPQGVCFARMGQDGQLSEKKLYAHEHPFGFFAERGYYPTQKRLWLATERGLVLSDPMDGSYEVYPFPSTVTAIAPDRKDTNTLWIGTQNNGIFQFDTQKRVAVSHIEHDPENLYSLRSNQITFLHTDTFGRLLVGLAGKGMAYTYLSHPFLTPHSILLDKANKITYSINQLFPLDNGDYLVGTEGGGLLRMSKNHTLLHDLKRIEGERIYSAIRINREYIIQSSAGFWKYNMDTEKITILQAQKAPKYVFQWLKIDNKLFAATDKGFCYIELQGNTLAFTADKNINDVLDFTFIQYGYVDTDSLLYIKSNYTDFAVFRYTGQGFSLVRHLSNQNYLLNDIIPYPWEKRYMLAATSAGIKVWDKEQKQWLGNENYFFNENIVSLSYHPYMGIWAATDNGLYRYAEKTKRFTKYGLQNGCSSEQFSGAKLVDDQIMMWGTVSGITHVPVRYQSTYLPKAYWALEKIESDGKKIENGCPSEFPTQVNVLPYNGTDFSLQISLQGIPEQQEGEIQYRLSGEDSVWKSVSAHAAFISYNRLSPGDYTLDVQYKPKWPAVGLFHKQIRITVLPAFYQTAWFKVLCFLLVLVVILLITRLVIRRQKSIDRQRMLAIVESQENERARIAADLHDDLGGKLSTLKLLLQETGRQHPTLKNMNLYTGSLELLDDSIFDLRTSLFNLNPRTLEENGVFAALEHLSQRVKSSGNIHIALEIPAEVSVRRFSLNVETVIYRILQELINNTLKHAHASSIDIRFDLKQETQLFIYYFDNGKGFDPLTVNKGLGLENIRTRIHLVNGKVEFQSSAGQGVKVLIFIPVKPPVL